MIAGILRRTPNARNTKFTTAAFRIIVGAIHFSPGVTATEFNAPTVFFCVSNCLFNFFLRMPRSSHLDVGPRY